MAERLDYYDIMPAGMAAYLSNYGFHFSKPMYEWAVSMMKDRNGNKLTPVDKELATEILRGNGVTIEHDKGYDVPYVWMMVKADYYGSSIEDDLHAARYVKNYLDDVDGSETRAFDEFYAKTVALGIPIIWEDVI